MDDVTDVYIWGSCRGNGNRVTTKGGFKGDPQVMVRETEVNLLNLVGNAMNLKKNSGSITIRVREQDWHLTDIVQFLFEEEETGFRIATREFHHAS